MLCSFVPELGSDSFISPRIGIGTAWAKKERSMKSSHVVPIFSGPFSEQSTARFLDKIPRVFWTFREICQNSIYCMSMSEHEHLIFLNKLIFVLDSQFHHILTSRLQQNVRVPRNHPLFVSFFFGVKVRNKELPGITEKNTPKCPNGDFWSLFFIPNNWWYNLDINLDSCRPRTVFRRGWIRICNNIYAAGYGPLTVRRGPLPSGVALRYFCFGKNFRGL